jgi:hypothetical protein
MPMKFETIGEAPSFRLGANGPVLVALYENGVTAAALQLLDKRQGEVLTQHPKLFSFTIVRGKVLKPPPAEVRQLAADLQGKYATSATGAAVIFDVTGLAAIIARSFMTALSLVAPPTMNQKTFKNLDEAVTWARSIPGQVAEAQSPELKAAIDRFISPSPRR